MKKLILSTALILTSILSYAQSAYEKVMTEKIEALSVCKTPEDFTARANDFARIAAKETNEWLPNYYAALAAVQKGRSLMMKGEVKNLDDVADEAQNYVDAAKSLSPENAELFILEKMIHSMRMMVNPQQRFMSEGMLAADALSKAEKIDPQNPRIMLLKAEDTYFTPEQFGGSKQRGMELFKKAKEQFKTYKPASKLHPTWGEEEVDYFLSQNK